MQNTQTTNLKIPGINLQEVTPVPVPELLTGVPVFLGVAKVRSPSTEQELVEEAQLRPQRLTLWNHFGQCLEQASPYLSQAVRGFFENGGRLCYVVALKNNLLEELSRGLNISEALDAVDLICAPDVMGGPPHSALTKLDQKAILDKQVKILEHCDRMGARFAILDALNQSLVAIDQQRQQLQGGNGALYVPWLKVENVADPIPPCGHVAGLYAQCDRAFGVHRTPANYPLEGILDLTLNLSDAEQASLNSDSQPGVNCLRTFRGRGMRVWGGRTLSQDPQWQYISVRRLFLTVGRWINLNLADVVVFEPNNFSLWLRLERELSVYCESLWRRGALQGATLKEAFYVKCDAETNPPSLREVGQVCVELGLAPTLPGEFIRISLIHGESGVTLSPS